jgi:hypothetical protein
MEEIKGNIIPYVRLSSSVLFVHSCVQPREYLQYDIQIHIQVFWTGWVFHSKTDSSTVINVLYSGPHIVPFQTVQIEYIIPNRGKKKNTCKNTSKLQKCGIARSHEIWFPAKEVSRVSVWPRRRIHSTPVQTAIWPALCQSDVSTISSGQFGTLSKSQVPVSLEGTHWAILESS